MPRPQPLNPDELTVEQKIGLMLLCRNPRDKADRQDILEMIRQRRLGGIHLGRQNEDASDFLAAADYPLLIADNMEAGYEGPDGVRLPWPLAIGATGCPQAAFDFGRITGCDAKAAGRNTVFGPIVDIAMHPAAACVGPRAFGGDAGTVSRMASASIRGYHQAGCIVTAKHYPGFGASPVDSHLGMVVLDCDEATLRARELAPYRAAMAEADLSGVMVGHIMVPAIDPELPASLSPRLIGLLREEGFGGLVMTDSLAMVGLTNMFGLDRCHRLAMAAGSDMIITSYRIGAEQAYAMMHEAWARGEVSETQIDAAARRVIAAQNRTLIDPPPRDLPADRRRAEELAARAITAVTADSVGPAIDPAGPHLFLLQTGNDFIDPQTGRPQREAGREDSLAESIRQRFPSAEIHRINDFPSRSQMEAASVRSMPFESVVAICVSRTDHYMGSADLTKRLLALLDGLGSKLQAVVLLGSAYAARELPAACPRIIFGYEGGACRAKALDVLAGTIEPAGSLPVPVRLAMREGKLPDAQ